MTWNEALDKAGADLLRRLGPAALNSVVAGAADGWPREAARQYQPLMAALRAVVGRGVQVSVVVKTMQGAGSALAGDEPYQAFTAVAGLEVWHWPTGKRTEPGAKMHGKLAVADRGVLFATSANLTQSGVGKNIEAGLLIRGGVAPPRAAEHVDALRSSGDLVSLS